MSIPGTYTSMRGTSGITFVGSGGRQTSTGNITVNAPVNVVVGDWVMIICQYDNSRSVDTPVGWTQLFMNDQECRVEVFYRFYDGTMPTLVLSGGLDHLIATSLAFRNVNATTPIDAAAVLTNNLSLVTFDDGSITYSTSGITTVTKDALVITCFGIESDEPDGIFSNFVCSSLTNIVSYANYNTSIGWDGGFSVWGALKTTAGATGLINIDTPITINNTPSGSVFALRPA